MSRSALPPLAIGPVVPNEFQDSWELTLRQASRLHLLRLQPHACFDAAVAAMHVSAVPSLTSRGPGQTRDVGFRKHCAAPDKPMAWSDTGRRLS